MPLSTQHRRMLLEDIILLLPGTMVVCLISRKHPLFNGPGSVNFKNKLELAMQDDPLKVTIFSSECFFGLNLLVRSNPKGDEIAAGIPSRDELKTYCLDRVYGAGINFEFVTGESHQFKFVDFFEHDKFIQLWHLPKTTRVAHLRRVIQNVSSAQTLAPTTLLLLREVYGDPFYSQTICSKHDICVCTKTHNQIVCDIKAQNVTTKGIKIMFELPGDDVAFQLFHDKVESICKQSIEDCYGSYTEMSAPILCEVRYSLFYYFFNTHLLFLINCLFIFRQK